MSRPNPFHYPVYHVANDMCSLQANRNRPDYSHQLVRPSSPPPSHIHTHIHIRPHTEVVLTLMSKNHPHPTRPHSTPHPRRIQTSRPPPRTAARPEVQLPTYSGPRSDIRAFTAENGRLAVVNEELAGRNARLNGVIWVHYNLRRPQPLELLPRVPTHVPVGHVRSIISSSTTRRA